MVAGVGKPLRIALRLDGGAADYEIHHPDAGTELVVCGDCGFEWDAAHTVTHDDGRVGYECPRCVLKLFVEARQRVIEETVRDGAKQLAARLRLEVASYKRQADLARAEVDRLRSEADQLPTLAQWEDLKAQFDMAKDLLHGRATAEAPMRNLDPIMWLRIRCPGVAWPESAPARAALHGLIDFATRRESPKPSAEAQAMTEHLREGIAKEVAAHREAGRPVYTETPNASVAERVVRNLVHDFRCACCGTMVTNHVVVSRCQKPGCEEHWTGPEVRSLVEHFQIVSGEAGLSSCPAQPGDPTVRHVVAWMRATYPMNQHAVEWADEIDHVFLGRPRKEGVAQHPDACMCFDCIAHKAAAVRRQGIVLQGWTCACGIFNGAEKEFLPLCRACGLERPQ